MKNIYKRAVAATGHEAVTGAAEIILKAGGNAFDAVVAAGFAGAVAEQTLTSLGGGGFLLARTAESQEIFFDFFVDTPGLGLEDQKAEPHFFPVGIDFGGSIQEFNIGLGSVAVPGTLKGLIHVHDRLGKMDLAEVLEPAVELARGHELNAFQAGFIHMLHPIMTMTETGRRLYEPDGYYVSEGDTLVLPEFVDFLHQLVEDKGESFYQVDIARVIDREMQEGGGLLTFKDLASYKVIERKPLRAKYRDYTLLTGPPPSLGGSLIALSLSLLEKMEPLDQWGSPEHLLRTLGMMQEVERLRDKGISNPEALADFVDGNTINSSVDSIRMFSRGTTHVSIADSEGNVASMTCSNGEGSGYFVPGTNIMLNNMMGEDDLHPDGFHSSPPGERIGSMMSPSALIRNNEVKLVFGSGGSKRIRPALTQVLTQLVDFKRDLNDAVHAPRLHWDGEVLQLEPGFDDRAVAALAERVPINIWDDINVYFGGVHSVIPGVAGAGDPRRGGSVVMVEV
ncbi:MAG: gamma-glutamyltransferase [Deltaproteobacteria bacterium]|nr:gamma-glutamyltransferase [Deltaproteobacteria bacterium]